MIPLLSLSFDDGRLDSFMNGYPLLKKYCIPATFNISSGYVFDSRLNDIGTMEPPMTAEMFHSLYQDRSIEVAGHGDCHQNTFEDLRLGLERLRFELGVSRLYEDFEGVASPGSALDNPVYERVRQQLMSWGVGYIRVSCRYLKCRRARILARKISRVIHAPALYSFAYSDTLMERSDDMMLYSVPVLRSTSVAEIDCLLRRAIKEGKSCILMFHSIVPPNAPFRDNWDYPSDKFEALCKRISAYANESRLIPLTTKRLMKELSTSE